MAGELTNSQIRMFLRWFVRLLCALAVVYLVASWDAAAIYDYLAYAFPIGAGITAGAGLVSRNVITGGDDNEKNASATSLVPPFAGPTWFSSARDWLLAPIFKLLGFCEVLVRRAGNKIFHAGERQFGNQQWWRDLRIVFASESWTDRWLYAASAFQLGLGLFFYCLSHTCDKLTAVIVCCITAMACLQVLDDRVRYAANVSDARALKRVINGITVVAGIVFGLFIVFSPAFFAFGHCVP